MFLQKIILCWIRNIRGISYSIDDEYLNLTLNSFYFRVHRDVAEGVAGTLTLGAILVSE